MLNKLPWLLLFASACTNAADFVVEDKALTPIPPAVAEAITATTKTPIVDMDNRPCHFLGKVVALRDSAQAADWLVTTADACSWAASAAPIWAVESIPEGFRVVLTFVTYDVTIGKSVKNGMHNIATGRGTAARVEEQLWGFDGKVYRLARNKIKELN